MPSGKHQPGQAAIRVENVRKVFRMGEVEVPVLHGIDLEIPEGEVSVILGASGSGKSTLLNLIGGIDRPSSGNIFFRGENIVNFSDPELTAYRRKNIGFVFQFYNLVATLNARENVQVATEVAEDPLPPEKALELVGLSDWREHFPAQLSGGQQQRVAIARALAKNPALLLCDEPTGALDAETGQLVLQTLIDLNERLGATILIITHAMLISQLAHRVFYLHRGRIERAERNKKRQQVREIKW
ncbi:MAG: ABC transporter ATP-binding protein [Victivallaceae bacterium]|nr:ABC transporter ATP-binding protein [Victivallaceae bacterium]